MAPIRNERESDNSKPPEKVPRPPNAWILYRTAKLKEMKAEAKDGELPMKQADISRIVGEMWKTERGPIRKQFEKAAAIAKEKHAKKYPHYKYKP
ncbi:HMG-box, partial [Trametes sanguinea]